MVETDGVAQAVQSILAAARERAGSEGRIAVNPRSLPEAFERAEADGRVPVVAEIKPTSPTTEGRRDEDPVTLAKAMVNGGAAALSVLTEPEHFGGSPADLRRVRRAVDVPVLRKDFVLRESQLDTVAADAVLLIARFVEDLEGMITAGRERGFQVLVEVHTPAEAKRAIAAGAGTVGINNRDLVELDVDLDTFGRVAPDVPDDVTLIAESGIGGREDVRRMRRLGADGLLVGSAIMGHSDSGKLTDSTVQANTRRLTQP